MEVKKKKKEKHRVICGNFMAKERALRVNCDSAGEVVIKERAKACAEMREEAKVKKWPLRRQIKTWNGARQKKKKNEIGNGKCLFKW